MALLRISVFIAAGYCIVRVIKSGITRLVVRIVRIGEIRKSRHIFV
jgi:hypothetical protein